MVWREAVLKALKEEQVVLLLLVYFELEKEFILGEIKNVKNKIILVFG